MHNDSAITMYQRDDVTRLEDKDAKSQSLSPIHPLYTEKSRGS